MAYDQLKTTFLAGAMDALVKNATLARLAYTDLSSRFRAAAENSTIRFVYFAKPTVTKSYASSDSLGGASAATMTSREMTMPETFLTQFHIDDGEDANAFSAGLIAQAGRVHGAALGEQLEQYMFSTMGARAANNRTDGADPFDAGNSAPFNDGIDTLHDIRGTIAKRDVSLTGLVGIMNIDAATALKKNAAFGSWDNRGTQGQDSTINGSLGRAAGFRLFESNNIPGRQNDGTGSVDQTTAAAVGATTFHVDGFGSAGVGRGDILDDGSRSYGVLDGYTGGEGDVTVNRGLLSSLSNNAALTSPDTKDSYFFDPTMIAWAMRPTVDANNSYADVQNIVDRNTGFALSLERQRTNARTTYKLTARFGCEIIRDEAIQRVIGVAIR